MKEIKLSGKRGQGKVTIVYDESYDWLNQWRWHITTGGYAARGVSKKERVNGRLRFTLLGIHRLIMQVTDPNIYIDHIDCDKLNNQRSNLRIATNSQNQANRIILKDSKATSKYVGVKRRITTNKYKGKVYKSSILWIASCRYPGGREIKSFKTEIEAALAYNTMNIKYHGEFARLNIIEE